MNPGFLALGALGGYIVYKEVTGAHAMQAAQPPKQQPHNELLDWLNGGGAPATANGGPNTDAQAIAGAVKSVAGFATSLVDFFGTSQDSGNDYGGGVGASTNNTSMFGTGAILSDEEFGK